MKCPACGTNNRAGVQFCEECGQKLPKPTRASASRKPKSSEGGEHAQQATKVACPACGHLNRMGVNFCEECGTSLLASPYLLTQSRRKRSLWLGMTAAGILVLCLLCGLLYWSMLIPVPLLSKTTPGADLLRRVRIFQENLGRPQAWEKNAQNARQQGGLQTVEFKDGRLVLPGVCGPQVDLEVGNVSRVQIWDELGQFGNGPLIYTMDNKGQSMAGGKFGYHVEWVVVDKGQRKIIKDNQWYACTGWEQDRLTCTGPDWRNYDSAQMCIYYEDPACQLPAQCYIFSGEDPFPAQDQQVCKEDATFTIDRIKGYGAKGAVWYIRTDDAQAYDGKYWLKTTTELGERQGYCRVDINHLLQCDGWDPNEFPGLKWEIIRMPNDLCVEPLASGTMGEVVVEQEVDKQADAVCEEQGKYFFQYETSVPVDAILPNWSFITDVPGIPTEDPGLFVNGKYWLKTTNSLGSEVEYPCGMSIDLARLECQGWNPRKSPPVEWEILQAPMEECTEPLATGTVGEVAAQQDANVRCDVFSAINMSVIYLDWQPGAALTFYVKMPGGVPGLEKTISGDNDPWNYSAQVGDYETDVCSYQGYKERLYCSVSLPFDYSRAVRPLSLYVNGCDTPIYSDQTADLPGIEGGSSSGGKSGGSSGGSCSSSLDSDACRAAGGIWDTSGNYCSCPNSGGSGSSCGSAPSGGCTSDYAAWCACKGGSYSCGFAGPVCIIP